MDDRDGADAGVTESPRGGLLGFPGGVFGGLAASERTFTFSALVISTRRSLSLLVPLRAGFFTINSFRERFSEGVEAFPSDGAAESLFPLLSAGGE